MTAPLCQICGRLKLSIHNCEGRDHDYSDSEWKSLLVTREIVARKKFELLSTAHHIGFSMEKLREDNLKIEQLAKSWEKSYELYGGKGDMSIRNAGIWMSDEKKKIDPKGDVFYEYVWAKSSIISWIDEIYIGAERREYNTETRKLITEIGMYLENISKVHDKFYYSDSRNRHCTCLLYPLDCQIHPVK